MSEFKEVEKTYCAYCGKKVVDISKIDMNWLRMIIPMEKYYLCQKCISREKKRYLGSMEKSRKRLENKKGEDWGYDIKIKERDRIYVDESVFRLLPSVVSKKIKYSVKDESIFRCKCGLKFSSQKEFLLHCKICIKYT